MSLPTFKFTNIIAPTNNERVNSGLSPASKMDKSGIISNSLNSKSNVLSGIKEKAQQTFKEMKMSDISLDVSDRSTDTDTDGFFSFATLIKLILIGIIVWFMWGSLSTNSDFHLGMGEFGDKISSFLKSMENKGRELISRITNTPMDPVNKDNHDSDSDSDNGNNGGETSSKSSSAKHHKKIPSVSAATHLPPVPPSMTNSSDKKPGFINDDTKYTFLDKADRSYTGPAPRADDSTSLTQKHQSGKSGYCYIGEDRGFRSCVKVDASDKCMSGEVYSRQETCIDPTLRE